MIRSKEQLQVVIVVSYTYPFIGSGIGNVARVQGEQLVKAGHTVTIISANEGGSQKTFSYKGVGYIKLRASRFLDRFNVPVPFVVFNGNAIKAIAKSDVVHIHDVLYPSSFIAAILGKLFFKKVIVTQHVPHVKYASPILNLIVPVYFIPLVY